MQRHVVEAQTVCFDAHSNVSRETIAVHFAASNFDIAQLSFGNDRPIGGQRNLPSHAIAGAVCLPLDAAPIRESEFVFDLDT